MTKEQIIEQLETSLNEYKGFNEAIDDAAFYIASEFDKLKDYSVAKERAKNYMSLKGALEPKQEKLEEAAKRIYGTDKSKDVEYYAFINGAKWQAERSCSEAIEFGKWLDENMQQREYYPMMTMTMEELFEQYKNK